MFLLTILAWWLLLRAVLKIFCKKKQDWPDPSLEEGFKVPVYGMSEKTYYEVPRHCMDNIWSGEVTCVGVGFVGDDGK